MNISIGSLGFNATLLVQMCNFWIAYCVVRWGIVQPVYRTIVERDAAIAHAQHAIAAARERLAHRSQERDRAWREHHASFMQQVPVIRMTPPASDVPSLTYPVLDVQTYEQLRNAARDDIVARTKDIV